MKKYLSDALLVAAIVLVVLMIITLVFFDAGALLRRSYGGLIHPFSWHRVYSDISNALQKRPVTADDARYITSWMTFDYVNRVFHLPTLYLQNSLNINDSHYPNLTINEAAGLSGQPGVTYLIKVQEAVRQYLQKVDASVIFPKTTPEESSAIQIQGGQM